MPTRRAEAEAADVALAAAPHEAAPAKINLALHVTGKRRDGYHLLDSLVVFAAVGDVLRAEPAEAGLELRLEGPFGAELSVSGPDADNLAIRAARALAETRRGERPATRIVLDKRLPIASGIGGGSADAAAALRLLDRHWRLDSGEAKLAKLAASLGADVPMCLVSEPLRAGGAGEKLTPVKGLPALPVVLINPMTQVSTEAVFSRLKAANDPPLPEIPKSFRSIFELAIWLRQTRNGLEEAARAELKLVARALTALTADPDCILARMSGSGATSFGIFASSSAAQRAAVRLRIARPDWWIAASVTGGS